MQINIIVPHLFFPKIFKLIQHNQDRIKQTFSNFDIFTIFKRSKPIPLFIFNNKIITIDEQIYHEIIRITEKKWKPLLSVTICHFFYPELKEAFGEEKTKDIKDELLIKFPTFFDNLEEKRKLGENDSYICSLIRQDSVDCFKGNKKIPILSSITSIGKSVFKGCTSLTHVTIPSTATSIDDYAFNDCISLIEVTILNPSSLVSIGKSAFNGCRKFLLL